MSQFPSLRPTKRVFNPGDLPVSSFRSISGKETRVLTGDTFHNHSADLTFENLQESAASSILEHFYNQKGTFLQFTLPSAVWAGWTEYTIAVDSTQKWRYAGRPTVTAVSPSIMTVSVNLVALA